MKKILLIAVLLFASCASGPDYESEHNSYLMSVKNARDNMSKVDFKKWLTYQHKMKKDEFDSYGGLQERESRNSQYHEQRSSETQGQNNLYEHKKQTSQLKLSRYNKKRKFLEKELFLLRGLLSGYDSPFVPKK
jgi:hypothetical protein